MLSKQPDKQAFIFLKDVRFADLKALVDYMYKGEVNVAQDQLTSFLQTAEALDIKGLAYKDNGDGGDLLSSSKTDKPSAPRFGGVKRTASESHPRAGASSKPQPAPKRPHVSPPVTTSEPASEPEVEEHFVAVEAKIEDQEEDPEDRLGGSNGQDWVKLKQWMDDECRRIS